MDNPVEEIESVVLRLTKGSPRTQEQALKQYFTTKSSFYHPFCSVHGNRDAILRIFQWYKIMSPHIEIKINSIAYDEKNLLLYVNISQIFSIFLIPFHHAHVTLTTVLQLEHGRDLNDTAAGTDNPLKPKKYYIRSQNDLYQTTQWIRFLLPWGIGTFLVLSWHWLATLACIICARVFFPLRWNNQRLADAHPVYPDVGEKPANYDGDRLQANGLTKELKADNWFENLRVVTANEDALKGLQRKQQ